MGFDVNIGGLSASVHDVRGLGRAGRVAQKRSLEAAGEVLEKAVKDHMNSTKYSLAALAGMDHPYARRHGSISVHPGREFVVHRRTGKMRDAVQGKTVGAPGGSGGGAKYAYRVGLDYAQQRYFKYVIQGTQAKMLPRDTLYQTAQMDKVQQGMMRAVVKVLGAHLRTQTVVRF